MNKTSNQIRLYFTAEKICIGSYNEVTEYEQETKKSYWASEFFQLPPDYNPVGQPLCTIEKIQEEWMLRN